MNDGGESGGIPSSMQEDATVLNDPTINGTSKPAPPLVLYNSQLIWLLGIGRVVAGATTFWNIGLEAGSRSFLGWTIFYGIGNVFLAMCLGEMASALPFTGGAYGYVRGIIGPFSGFFVGLMEIAINLALLALFVIAAGESVSSAFDLPLMSQPAVWIVIVVFSVAVQIPSNQSWFVFSSAVLTIISLVIWLVYVFGSIPFVDVNAYEREDAAYDNSPAFRAIHTIGDGALPTVFFSGIEVLPVLGRVSMEPKRSIPIGLYIASSFSLIFAVTIVYIASFQYPGSAALANATLPLNYGFQRILNTNSRLVSLLNLPMILATMISGIFSLGRVVKSMAESGLLPRILSEAHGKHQFPYNAMIAFSLATLCGASLIAGVKYHSVHLMVSMSSFFGWSLYGVYITIFVTYLSFVKRFPRLSRKCRNPLGKTSAYAGILIFATIAVSMLFYTHGPYVLIAFLLSCVVYLAIYLLFIRKHQRFCDEEEKVMFIALVLKANEEGRAKMKRRQQLQHMNRQSMLHSHSASVAALVGPAIDGLMHSHLHFPHHLHQHEEDHSMSHSETTEMIHHQQPTTGNASPFPQHCSITNITTPSLQQQQSQLPPPITTQPHWFTSCMAGLLSFCCRCTEDDGHHSPFHFPHGTITHHQLQAFRARHVADHGFDPLGSFSLPNHSTASSFAFPSSGGGEGEESHASTFTHHEATPHVPTHLAPSINGRYNFHATALKPFSQTAHNHRHHNDGSTWEKFLSTVSFGMWFSSVRRRHLADPEDPDEASSMSLSRSISWSQLRILSAISASNDGKGGSGTRSGPAHVPTLSTIKSTSNIYPKANSLSMHPDDSSAVSIPAVTSAPTSSNADANNGEGSQKQLSFLASTSSLFGFGYDGISKAKSSGNSNGKVAPMLVPDSSADMHSVDYDQNSLNSNISNRMRLKPTGTSLASISQQPSLQLQFPLEETNQLFDTQLDDGQPEGFALCTFLLEGRRSSPGHNGVGNGGQSPDHSVDSSRPNDVRAFGLRSSTDSQPSGSLHHVLLPVIDVGSGSGRSEAGAGASVATVSSLGRRNRLPNIGGGSGTGAMSGIGVEHESSSALPALTLSYESVHTSAQMKILEEPAMLNESSAANGIVAAAQRIEKDLCVSAGES